MINKNALNKGAKAARTWARHNRDTQGTFEVDAEAATVIMEKPILIPQGEQRSRTSRPREFTIQIWEGASKPLPTKKCKTIEVQGKGKAPKEVEFESDDNESNDDETEGEIQLPKGEGESSAPMDKYV